MGSVSYFLGFEVVRDNSSLMLTQSKYVLDLLNRPNTNNAKNNPSPMCTSKKLFQGDSALFSVYCPSLYKVQVQ